jgi:hypothetical protein
MPHRPTSSSTTVSLPPADNAASDATWPGRLSADQCELLLALFYRGASPAQACHELGLDIRVFWNTIHADAAFHAAARLAVESLSHNVVAALYKSAIGGSVSAQQFWLKQRPASLWLPPVEDREADDLSHLDDAELAQALAETRGDLAAAEEPGGIA